VRDGITRSETFLLTETILKTETTIGPETIPEIETRTMVETIMTKGDSSAETYPILGPAIILPMDPETDLEMKETGSVPQAETEIIIETRLDQIRDGRINSRVETIIQNLITETTVLVALTEVPTMIKTMRQGKETETVRPRQRNLPVLVLE